MRKLNSYSELTLRFRLGLFLSVIALPAKTVPNLSEFCFGSKNDEKF